MISPTVGRVVWFWPSTQDTRVAMAVRSPRRSPESGDFEQPQPLAALVAYVFDDRLVNLTVSDHDGNTYARQNVQLVQEADAKPDGVSFATWMPFQVGQAKRHEQPTAPAIDLPALEQGLAEKLGTAVDKITASLHDSLKAHLDTIEPRLHGIVADRFAQLLAQASAKEKTPA